MTSGIGRQARSGPRWLAWSIFAFAVAWVVAGSAMLLLGLARGTLSSGTALGQFALLPSAASFSVVGLAVALRQPRNACGWLMLVIGAIWSMGVSPQADEGSIVGWLSGGGWVPPFGLMATHLPLRLPNGHLLSPRWRWVSRLSTTAIVITVVGFLFDPEVPGNPIANEELAAIALLGIILLAVCAMLSIASLVIRARRAGADERHQIRWIAAGASVFLGAWIVALLASSVLPPSLEGALQLVGLLFYAAIPVSIGIAILKYRLYDIDVVIRKALVVAVLAVFFVVVYALVVGGVGALVETSSSSTLSFAAAVLVAVLFQPVLARARRFADRVVYGKRATPYEVLAEFGDQLAETYAADDVLPRTARVLAEGVGAESASVWLAVGDELRRVATWPGDAGAARPDDHRTDVRHQGELLGALSVAMPANDPMDPSKEKLIADLAAQAGLVLRNVRLVEDLRGSRRRLVSAQDEERRKLERNIHDGAQQQLVALAVKARLARQMTDRDPDEGRRPAEPDRGRDPSGPGGLARPRSRHLPSAPRGQGPPGRPPGSGSQVADPRGGHPRWHRALPAVGRGRRLLLGARGPPERREVRGRLARRRAARTHGIGADVRGPRRRAGVRPASTGYGSGLQGIADRLAALNGNLLVASSVGGGTTLTGSIPFDEEAG